MHRPNYTFYQKHISRIYICCVLNHCSDRSIYKSIQVASRSINQSIPSTPGAGFGRAVTTMASARKIGLCTFISTLIQSVFLVFIQDTFMKCYYVAIQPYYQTLVVDSASKCSLVCLGNGQCAGFDFCITNSYDNEQLCQLRNESSVASCIVQHPREKKTDRHGCTSYRRVCIYSMSC
jgi:hypothetical protein